MTVARAPIAPHSRDRRRLIGALLGSPFLAACQAALEAPERGPIAGVFTGRIDDGGFHEQGYRGLLRVRDQLHIPIQSVDRIAPDRESILSALRDAAQSAATMIVAHGGVSSEAVQRVAWEFPHKRFTLIQGDRLRPNLAIYRVQAEQSAWLAGAAAGLLSRTGLVGHVFAQPDEDTLNLRNAFVAGARTTNAKIHVIDPVMQAASGHVELSRMVSAQRDAGADLLFVTGAPPHAIDATWEATRRRGVRLIGQGRDWVAARPHAFVASAVADTGAAIIQLGRDLQDSMWRGDQSRRYGLRYPEMVRLVLAPDVPANTVATLDELRGQVASGRIVVPGSDAPRKLDPTNR